jgi:hypothetical protein
MNEIQKKTLDRIIELESQKIKIYLDLMEKIYVIKEKNDNNH